MHDCVLEGELRVTKFYSGKKKVTDQLVGEKITKFK